MSYRRSISTLGCPEYSLEQVLDLAKRHRLDAVEIRALSNTIDVPAVLAAAYGTPAVLAERMQSAPAPIVSLDTSLKLADNRQADRDDFLKFVPWAEACGVPWLRAFDGGKNADAATHQAMADTVAWWRAERKKHGWKADLMIETHDALFTAASIKQFLALAPGTAILWDSQHTWRNGSEAPLDTWRAIKSHVVHIHVKDSISQPSAKHPFSYVLPGEGEFAMPPLRAALAAEFTGCVSLEWEKLWHPYLAPLDDALTAAAQRNWW
ncbi:MAG: sugar phosphate isomerase/epimerase [Lacunisphaera sp.]|jgi:sugar phosphate isomerase/epimerase|nr:sugar phosphate isomerase/epimerase [Lacunisphaera sp.]